MDESVVCTVPSPSRATKTSLPTEEVTLEVQATSASSGKYCTICKKITLPGSRRTLNPKSAESDRRVVSFLQQYASTALLAEPGPGCYICRSCFSDAEKGDKSLQTALYNIKSIRKTMGLPAVTTAVSVVETSVVETSVVETSDNESEPCSSGSVTQQPPQRPRGNPKKLFYSPRARTSLSASPLVQVSSLCWGRWGGGG